MNLFWINLLNISQAIRAESLGIQLHVWQSRRFTAAAGSEPPPQLRASKAVKIYPEKVIATFTEIHQFKC